MYAKGTRPTWRGDWMWITIASLGRGLARIRELRYYRVRFHQDSETMLILRVRNRREAYR